MDYKEKLRLAKEALDSGSYDRETIEYIFPELAESEDKEDERIRKELLEHCKNQAKPYIQTVNKCHQIQSWIAWLESKGEQYNNEYLNILQRFSFYSYKDEPNILYLSGLYVNENCRNKGIGTKILEVADEVAKSLNCHAIRLKTKIGSNAERLYRRNQYHTLKREGNQVWLEKQGEQKETLCDKCRKAQPSHSCQDITALGRCYIDDINTSNNIKPQFHEGDWVVYKNEVCQIVKREEGCNKLVTVFGIEKELVNERNLSTARLWTIQDAKEGDVLVVNNGIFIYAHRKQMYSIAIAHCFVDSAGRFYLDGEFGYTEKENSVHPATKEQRDLLFQKMKEAEYEWDDEKKELRKLEKQWSNDKRSIR